MDDDTKPLEGPITEPLGPADYPTAPILAVDTRTGAKGASVWALLTLALTAAMGGGVWFATSANAGLGPSAPVSVAPAITDVSSTIILPTDGQTLPGTPTPAATYTTPTHTVALSAQTLSGTPTPSVSTTPPPPPPSSDSSDSPSGDGSSASVPDTPCAVVVTGPDGVKTCEVTPTDTASPSDNG